MTSLRLSWRYAGKLSAECLS